jgi:hypothetical protein
MLVLSVCIALATASCRGGQEQSANVSTTPDVVRAAQEVVAAMQAKDGERLAGLAHPQKGVRFSPYAYVDREHDRVFSGQQIKKFWTDRQTYNWGDEDGTGDPIMLTPAQYYERFIMDRDFANPSSISVNADRASGNTQNNAAVGYPDGTRVELYLAPASGNPEFDWAALRLVFEQVAGTWYLVGVIHDQWTT